jgi:hypothetical protein
MKMTNQIRKPVNAALYDLCLKRHDGIPAKAINEILQPFGLHLEECIFCGREGRDTVELLDNADKVCENAYLVLYWKKGDHVDSYEINAYVS